MWGWEQTLTVALTYSATFSNIHITCESDVHALVCDAQAILLLVENDAHEHALHWEHNHQHLHMHGSVEHTMEERGHIPEPDKHRTQVQSAIATFVALWTSKWLP